MIQTLLDTSFIYAYFQHSDIHHKEAVQKAKDPNFGKPVIPYAILQELINIINRKQDSKETIRVIDNILANEELIIFIEPQTQHFQRTWQTFQKLSPHHLSYVDCLLITLAEELECTVLTFDKNLQKVLNQNE
jgi:predicted nucleic acid-binding protein